MRGVHRAALAHVDVAGIGQLGRAAEVVQRDRELAGPGPVRQLAPGQGHPAPGGQRRAVQAERVPVRQRAPGRVDRGGVLPRAEEIPGPGPVAVGQADLRLFGHAAVTDQLGPHHGGQLGRLLVRPRQEHGVPAHQQVHHVQGHRVPHGRLAVAAADAAPGVVGLERRPGALAELERGQALPLRVEPPDLGQLPVAQVCRDEAHHAARLYRAQLGGVTGQDRAGAGGPDHGQHRGQVLGGELGRLVQRPPRPGASAAWRRGTRRPPGGRGTGLR